VSEHLQLLRCCCCLITSWWFRIDSDPHYICIYMFTHSGCVGPPAQQGAPWRFLASAHGDGDVDAQVAVVGEQVRDGGVEHQAVAVHDGGRHAVVDGAGRGLPGEAAPVSVELQAVREVLGLLAGSDEQNHGEELLVALVLLLLLQHQHEVVAEARLHHHPVHRARQVDVRGQEHDVLALGEEPGLPRQ